MAEPVGSEWRCVLTSVMGEIMIGKGSFNRFLPSYRRRRERGVSGALLRVADLIGDGRKLEEHMAHGFRLLMTHDQKQEIVLLPHYPVTQGVCDFWG
jgi:hypothetical protein